MKSTLIVIFCIVAFVVFLLDFLTGKIFTTESQKRYRNIFLNIVFLLILLIAIKQNL